MSLRETKVTLVGSALILGAESEKVAYASARVTRQNTDNTSGTVYYKFGTIPATGTTNGPLLRIQFAGGQQGYNLKAFYEVIVATRNGFTGRVSDANIGDVTGAGVVIYREVDNSYSLYIKLTGGLYSSGQVTVQEGSWGVGASYLELVSGSPSNTSTPSGTLVFDGTVTTTFTGINSNLANGNTLIGTLTDTGIGTVQVVGTGSFSFGSTVGDKLYFYSNTYGVGVESSTLTYWSSGQHRWRIGGTAANSGTEYMLLTTGALTVKTASSSFGIGSGAVAVSVNGGAANARDITFQTNGVTRWVFRADSTAEGGSNAGSNLAIQAYNDAGTLLTTPISIVRSTGAVTVATAVTFSSAPTFSSFTSTFIPFFTTGGLLSQSGSFTFNSGTGTMSISAVSAGVSISTPALTVSGLTSGRVSFTSTGGLQTDNSLFTYSTTSGLGALRANFVNGEISGTSTITQMAFGYNGSLQYPHFIQTQHNAGAAASNRIRFYTSDGTAAGVFPTNAVLGLTIENGRATAPQVAASNLTSGRSTFATTSGQLTDSANLTFDGTNFYSTSFVSTGSTAGYQFNGRDATASGILYATSSKARLYYNAADRLTVDTNGAVDITGPLTSGDNEVYTVTLPTVVSNAADVCTVVNANFSGAVEVTLNVHLSGYAQTKHYYVPLAYDGTANTWQLVTPLYTSGPYGGNDTELDIRISASTATFRVRRTAGSTAGVAQISVRLLGDRTFYAGGATGTQLAASATTYTSQTVTVSYAATALSVTSAGVVKANTRLDVGPTSTSDTVNVAASATARVTVESTSGNFAVLTFRQSGSYKYELGMQSGTGLFYVYDNAGGAYRLGFDSGGKIIFGDPSSGDTNLYRGGVDLLKTDDVFIAASIGGAVTTVTGAVTLGMSHHTVLADPTTAAFTISLPAVASVPVGKQYVIKKIGSSNNAVTADPSGTETVDGALTIVIRDINEVCTLVNTGVEWKRLDSAAGTCPVGTVVAWHKSFPNTPALPSGWVECNGQTLSDAGSVYGGGAQIIPNLNGSGGTQKYFLRGSTTSGTTGGSDTHSHTSFTLTTASVCAGSITVVSGITGTSTVNNIPSHTEFVFIMRIK